MYLAYCDESGDPGPESAERYYSVAAVLVEDAQWRSTLEQLLLLRRALNKDHGLMVRDEIKAAHLVHARGSIRPLKIGPDARMRIFRRMMTFQHKCGNLTTFAVVMDKDRLAVGMDIFDEAWTHMIERLATFGRKKNTTVLVCPDEGHNELIQKKVRKMRHYSMVPSAINEGERLDRRAENIIEDPFFRPSTNSYLIQLADLNAYAARHHVAPNDHCDASMWDRLADARLAAVNRLHGGPVGIRVFP